MVDVVVAGVVVVSRVGVAVVLGVVTVGGNVLGVLGKTVVVVVSPEVVLEVGTGVPVEAVEGSVAGVSVAVVEGVETQ